MLKSTFPLIGKKSLRLFMWKEVIAYKLEFYITKSFEWLIEKNVLWKRVFLQACVEVQTNNFRI